MLQKLINYVSAMSAMEVIILVVGMLVLFFLMSHPLITMILFGIAWWTCTAFRTTIKELLKKWKL